MIPDEGGAFAATSAEPDEFRITAKARKKATEQKVILKILGIFLKKLLVKSIKNLHTLC
jgi:hypothetical protein